MSINCRKELQTIVFRVTSELVNPDSLVSKRLTDLLGTLGKYEDIKASGFNTDLGNHTASLSTGTDIGEI